MKAYVILCETWGGNGWRTEVVSVFLSELNAQIEADKMQDGQSTYDVKYTVHETLIEDA